MNYLKLLFLLHASAAWAKPYQRLPLEKPMLFESTSSPSSVPSPFIEHPLDDGQAIVNQDEDENEAKYTVSRVDPNLVATSIVIAQVPVSTITAESGVVQSLPSPTVQPQTIGTIITSLDTQGHATDPPMLQSHIPAPTTTLSPASETPQIAMIQSTQVSQNIFQPVATEAPPPIFTPRSDHPISTKHIKSQNGPLATNKFYSNFFLGNQTAGTWTHPYSLSWVKGKEDFWGISITHTDAKNKVFGPEPRTNPDRYFLSPIGILSVVLSSAELGPSTTLTVDSLTAMSANINLHPNEETPPQLIFPLVQGMGFITALFHGGTPILQSKVLFRTVTKISRAPKSGVSKYKITLEDATTWLLYAYSPSGASLELSMVSHELIKATSKFEGTVQLAKNPADDPTAEDIYDAACGAFASSVDVSGSVNGDFGSYTLNFVKRGLANSTLAMFALPHHVASFSTETASAATKLQLETTTKGNATAIVAESWTMVERLPVSMGFAPWSPQNQSQKYPLSQKTINTIHDVARSEISQDMCQQTSNDIYFGGKAFAKFALIAHVIHEQLQDKALAQAGMISLKKCFANLMQDTSKLAYDTVWKGIVAQAPYGDPANFCRPEFGNSCYNDHHFHYGYYVLAAALIGSIDPGWVVANKDYVNTLIRDFANPSPLDSHFPVSRNFDWYHGHSWAHGIQEYADGKDQESSSEDSMSAYALKMWGHVSGDENLEARGNLQLAVNARSIRSYYLYESTNTIQPASFIGNKAAGILFENKIDHVTYFGANIEFVQGIHMLPLLPSSALTRTAKFVQEEWDTFFSNGRADAAQGGWKSILYANLALADPKASWKYFTSPSFSADSLDDGASRTWYMAHAAGFGGDL